MNRPELTTLVDAAEDLSLLYTRIGRLTTEPRTPGVDDGTGRGAGGGKKISASPAPWNAMAAGWVMDVHAGVREHQTNIAWLAYGNVIRQASSADTITHKVIRLLPDMIYLCYSKFPNHRYALDAERDLMAWGRRGRTILDEVRPHEEPWTKAPGNVKCPYCGKRLMLKPGWQYDAEPLVWCARSGHEPMSWLANERLATLQDDETTAV